MASAGRKARPVRQRRVEIVKEPRVPVVGPVRGHGHLGKLIVGHAAVGANANVWSTAIDFPKPEPKDDDVGRPDGSGGVEKAGPIHVRAVEDAMDEQDHRGDVGNRDHGDQRDGQATYPLRVVGVTMSTNGKRDEQQYDERGQDQRGPTTSRSEKVGCTGPRRPKTATFAGRRDQEERSLGPN